MCILHIVFCTVCKYVLSICKLLFFLHCLEHARKNFTHQGTCAVVRLPPLSSEVSGAAMVLKLRMNRL